MVGKKRNLTLDHSRMNNNRRKLRFNSLEEVLDEAHRIAHAPHVAVGKWSAGQIFQHLAKAYLSSVDESKAKLPLPNRLVAKLLKPILLRYGLPSGVQIEPISEVAAREFLPAENVATEEGLRQLQEATRRLSPEAMTARHNLFGEMSPREWEMMHCRHAELHMGFLVPVSHKSPAALTDEP